MNALSGPESGTQNCIAFSNSGSDSLWPCGRNIVIAKHNGFESTTLRHMIGDLFPLSRIRISFTGSAALAALTEERAELLVLGLTFPDIDGIDVIDKIIRERLADKIMVFSGRWDANTLRYLRFARVDGVFDAYNDEAASFPKALRQVVGGQQYISPGLRDAFLGQTGKLSYAQILTPAELYVFSIIGDGCDNGVAAGFLGLSECTVQNHRRSIMKKLRVHTNSQMLREALKLGVVRITAESRILRPGLSVLTSQHSISRDARRVRQSIAV